MTNSFNVLVPITNDMSPSKFVVSESSMETKEEYALWEYNRMRGHDGLDPLTKMPNGTTYKRID